MKNCQIKGCVGNRYSRYKKTGIYVCSKHYQQLKKFGKVISVGPALRGFAAMDPEKRKSIASIGGKAASLAGTAHRWTQEEARKFGSIGGKGNSKKSNG